jgi:hypothetical protein
MSYDNFLAKEQDLYFNDDRICCHECGWVGNIETVKYAKGETEIDDMICPECGEEIK